jgi:DnaK suppressor protein
LKAPVEINKPRARAGLTSQDKPAAASVRKPAKPAAKSAKPAKTTAKKTAKKTAKAVVKPAAGKKPALKSASKPVKAAAKPVAKKSASKSVAKKAAAKTALKKPPLKKPVAKKPVAKKSVAKTMLKSAVKSPAKSAAKAPVKLPAKAASKPVAKALPVAPLAPQAPVARPAVAPSPRTRGRAAAEALAPAPVAPTHAPDAAKASYMGGLERTIAPPPPVVVIRKDPKLANNWKNKSPEKLTDEEVMAMPDSEYMNDVQLAFFRHKLSQLKHDIHSNAGETTEHLREDTVVVPDPADRATIEEEHALELRTRDRERKLLKKIEQSLARIDAGDYGYCDETGEPIGVGRLIARPTASLSLEAQQRRELRQKMFGD